MEEGHPATQMSSVPPPRRSERPNFGQIPTYLANNYVISHVQRPPPVNMNAPLPVVQYSIPGQWIRVPSCHPPLSLRQNEENVLPAQQNCPPGNSGPTSGRPNLPQRPDRGPSEYSEAPSADDVRESFRRRQRLRDEQLRIIRRSLQDEEETEAEMRRRATPAHSPPAINRPWEIRSNTPDAINHSINPHIRPENYQLNAEALTFRQAGPYQFHLPGPPPQFNRPGPPPQFNLPGPPPQFNLPGPLPQFNQPRPPPQFNLPGPPPQFSQPEPQPQSYQSRPPSHFRPLSPPPYLYHQLVNESQYLDEENRPPFYDNRRYRNPYEDLRHHAPREDHGPRLRDHDPILPRFTGDPSDWLEFKAAVEEAKEFYTERGIRAALKRHLEGGPLQMARSSFMISNSIDRVMSELEESYGRPDFIVRAVRQKLKLLTIPEATSRNANEQLAALVAFAQTVRTLTASMILIPGHSFSNPELLSELVAKLPFTMRLSWGQFANARGSANLDEFHRWLSSYASAARTVATEPLGAQIPANRARFNYHEEGNVEDQKEPTTSCPLCESSRHHIVRCAEFKAMTPQKRREVAQQLRLCFACLKGFHFQSDCQDVRPCATQDCGYNHHGMLCNRSQPNNRGNRRRRGPKSASGPETRSYQPAPKPDEEPPTNNSELKPDQAETGRLLTSRAPEDDSVLFKILPVTLHGPTGKRIDTFALFDDACSFSLLDQEVAHQLELEGRHQPLCLAWSSEISRSEDDSQAVQLQISARGSEKLFRMSNVRTVASLSLQPQSVDATKLKLKFSYLSSADIPSLECARPRLIIGVDQAKLGFPLQFLEGGWQDPIAIKTRLGWVAYGPSGSRQNRGRQTASLNLHLCSCSDRQIIDDDLSRQLKHFFSTEAFGVPNPPTPLEAQELADAKATFSRTTRRLGNRWETGLLWKMDPPSLPDTKPMAMKRWQCLQRKMARDEKLRKSMTTTIENYLGKGYARRLTSEEARRRSAKTNYLPMFGIYNPNKGKFRAVSDAAAKVKGLSLNDCLSKGPQLYTGIFIMLFNFRLGRHGIIGDIVEMFHQVAIIEEDQDAQRFLWTSSLESSVPPEEFKMTVMTFGATCSPSLAQQVKNLNAEEFKDEFPEAVHAIKRNHYVDDLLYTRDEPSDLVRVAKEIIEVHRRGGFEMRGFVSDSREVMLALGEDPDTVSAIKPFQSDPDGLGASEMVLGLVWDTSIDAFRFQLNFHRVAKEVMTGARPPTRREVTSALGSLYDPLGLVAHFRISLAMLSQELAKTTSDWDLPIPEPYLARWRLWLTELPDVSRAVVPRALSQRPLAEAIASEIHVFVDASDRAFATVAYVRLEYPDNSVVVSFLAARAKVGPIKQISINRMELQAAVLGSRLAAQIRNDTDLTTTKRYFWSDSQTVHAWVNSVHRTYKAFVGVRVTEILEETSADEWHYVPTNLNPADLATKRSGKPEFAPDCLWFQGPPFLRQSPSKWPLETPPPLISEAPLEIKPPLKAVNIHQDASPLIDAARFPTWWRLKRALAAVFRAAERFKLTPAQRKLAPPVITIQQSDAAETKLIIQAQRQGFPEDTNALQRGRCLPSQSKLLTCCPFLDPTGMMRMRSRLQSAPHLGLEVKLPPILPRGHRVTELIILQTHATFSHQNVNTVVNELRQHYHIPQIRAEVKKVLGRCRRCSNARARPRFPIMAPLPLARLSAHAAPFTHTGVDLAGPFEVRIGRSNVKRWIVLFTCLTIRAVHIEVAHSLSTDSFILCLRNFLNRRGRCREMYSDCGTNFKGADKELRQALQELEWSDPANEAAKRGINWNWNPPAAPHQGGAWERLVKSVKSVLKVLLHNRPLKDDTFYSFLVETEYILNSRPLTHVPVESEAQEALTPNHFLLGSSSGFTPEGNICPPSQISRKQWRQSQELAEYFWTRWLKEYAPELARRSKWHQPSEPLKVGDCVLIIDENAPRNRWERGVIIRTNPSKIDGIIRSAEVKTPTTIRTRPTVKLAVLSLQPDEAQGP